MNKERKTKACPYCGEEILAVAIKCKHCGEWLNKEEESLEETEDTQNIANQETKAEHKSTESEEVTTEKRETKKCPYCGEEILAVAVKCKYCDEWLDDDEEDQKEESDAQNAASQESTDQESDNDDEDEEEYDPMEEVPEAVNKFIWVFVIVAVAIGEFFLVNYTIEQTSHHGRSGLTKGLWVLCVLLLAGIPKIVKVLKNIYNMIFYK